MPESFQLNQDPGWVSLGSSGMRMRAPGLKGNLIWRPPAQHAPLTAGAGAISPSVIAPGAPDLIEQAPRKACLSTRSLLNSPGCHTKPLSREKLCRTPIH
jgi:hypothetical protein